MMNKLIVLVLAIAITAPALADDFSPAPFRGEPGSMFMEWTYETAPPVTGRNGDLWDGSDNNSFEPHPDKGDPVDWSVPYSYTSPTGPYYVPAGLDYTGVYGCMMEAAGPTDFSDPCMPYGVPTSTTWYDQLGGLPDGSTRQGVLGGFAGGSWEMRNFISESPGKDFYIQITYTTGTGDGTTNFSGFIGGFGVVELPEEEWYMQSWASGMDTWLDDPCDPCSVMMYSWGSGEELVTENFFGEFGEDLEFVPVEQTILGDGFVQAVFEYTAPMNPTTEFVGFIPEVPIFLDQIIFETLCYVPEPATMALLGLGSLLMIRRKR
ncbi:MAG: PEP-CTERM sorting domain-containing protein [Planctomycetota bacterium]|jgi:hypothetical protein